MEVPQTPTMNMFFSKKTLFIPLLAAAVSLLATPSAKAQGFIGNPSPAVGESGVFAFWNFNSGSSSTSGTYSPSALDAAFGSSVASLSFTGSSGLVVFGGTVTNLPEPPADETGRGVALAVQVGTDLVNNGESLIFALNLSVFEDVVMTFAGQRTSTGFDSIEVSYSIDGGATYTVFGSVPLLASSMGTTAEVPASIRTLDLSGVSAINGQSRVRLKLTLDGGTASSGNIRLDNVQFTGTRAESTTPLITSFSPTIGLSGTSVTISGINFTGATEVAFNGVATPFNVLNDETITTAVPIGATTGPITVAVGAEISSSGEDFVVGNPNPPTVSLSASLVDFVTETGVVSPSQTIAVSGTNLGSENVTVTAPSGFQISQDGSNYSTEIVLSPTGGTLASTSLDVRVSAAAAAGILTGDIEVQSPLAASVFAPLRARVLAPVVADFPVVWLQNSNELPVSGFGFLSTAFPQPADVGSGRITVGGGATGVTTVNANGSIVFANITSPNGTTVNTFEGAPAGGSITLSGGADTANNGAHFQFQISMAGHRDLQVSYATQRTSTGFDRQIWSYSTDGVNFTELQTIDAIPASYGAVALGTITELNDAATAYLRVTFEGATGAAGNNRLDNITFQATEIQPDEPLISVQGDLLPFNTTVGAPSAAQTLTVSATNLGANLDVAAPAGFELSVNGGASYASSASLTPSSGVVGLSQVAVRLTGEEVGSPSGVISFTSTGASTVNRPVAGTVTAPSGDYDAWAGGFGLDPNVTTGPNAGAPTADPDGDGFTNEQEFAFGTNPTVGNAALLQATTDGNGNLVFTYIERDAGVTYAIETRANLSTGSWLAAGLTPTNSPDQSGVESGYTRKQFIVADPEGNAFYRVRASIQ